jgi:hypothetical protein
MQEQRYDAQHHHQARRSMGDIAEGLGRQLERHTSSTRKRAESDQSQTTISSRVLSPLEIEQLPQQALISAYLRSSYHGDNADRPGRYSSAGCYVPSSSHPSSQGEMRRISGNFNAPTEIEVERQRSHTKRSRGMGKLKDAVKGLVRA